MDLKKVVMNQRKFFDTGKSKEVDFRIDALRKLKQSILKNEKEIMEALKKDFKKSNFEAYETEIGIILDEIHYILKHIKKWTRAKRVKTPLAHFISTSKVYSEPYGVALIISPWNYPFQLTMAPLIGAIAAGNCVVVKTASYTPEVSRIICKIIKGVFKEEYICVVEGGREVNEILFKEKFDYIFFTGSPSVGKIIMKEAAENLTPLTLELGGKSPCIISKDAEVSITAKRLAWGKFINAGQTCVAPDYVLVHKDIKNQLIENLDKHIKEFYGENPKLSEDFPRIINKKHFLRLKELIDFDKVVIGGKCHEDDRYISPTVMSGVLWEDKIMEDEIFGPILPIIEYENIDEIIQRINSRPKPLALYLFANNIEIQKEIIKNISFGGGCINDTIVHLATPYMAFGGVGESGMGAYHGKASFDTFSHKKSIMKKSNIIDIPLRYPPYSEKKLSLLKRILK